MAEPPRPDRLSRPRSRANSRRRGNSALRVAVWIAVVYLAAGCAWALAVHHILPSLVPSPEFLPAMQAAAVGFFVALSAGVIGLVIFVALRKAERDAEALRQSAEKFARVFRSSPDAIVIGTMEEGRIIEVNESFLERTGYSRDDVMGRTGLQLGLWVRPEDRERLIHGLRTSGEQRALEIEFRVKSGAVRIGQVSAQSIRIQEEPCLMMVVRDVTQWKETIGRLQAARDHVRALYDASPDLFLLSDAEGRLLDANTSALERVGCRRSEFLDLTADDLFRVRGRPGAVRDAVARAASGESLDEEWEVATRSGDAFPAEVNLRRVELAGARGERRASVLLVARDVSQRKRAERALRESEERYRLFFQANPLPMGVYEVPSGRILDVNDAAVRHYGYSRDEFIGLNLKAILAPVERVDLGRKMRELAAREQNWGLWKHTRKDGTVMDVEVTSHALEFAGKQARLVLVNDVTERRRLEEQLLQSQKMEAIGLLAGGVAHDFNNVLTAISGYTELILATPAFGDPMRSHMEEIRKATHRATELTQRLLAFGRKQVMRPQVLNMDRLVRGMEGMLRRLIGEDVELTCRRWAGEAAVRADPGQIEQVIVNLVVNARDAMPGGGRLVLETAEMELEEDQVPSQLHVRPGRYVVLSVTDTGCGMDEATQTRIFEPFFTTKEPGKGTGLGLSTVYGIVRQSGGHVTVHSEPDRGTTFRVYLPWVEVEAEGERSSGSRHVPRGSETVLLVEDEEVVRALLGEALARSGYEVLEAGDGREALDVLDRTPRRPDILVTDVVMPHLGGKALAAAARRKMPGLKVIFISGYAGPAVVGPDGLPPGDIFLQKPFSPSTLLLRIREVLDGSSG